MIIQNFLPTGVEFAGKSVVRYVLRGAYTFNSVASFLQTQDQKKLSAEKFVPCFLDALVNAGISVAPGGGVALAVLNYFGVSVNIFQKLAGQTDLFSGQADIVDSAKAVSSVAKDAAIGSYAVAGGDVALNRAKDLATRGSFQRASLSQQAKRLANLKAITKLSTAARVLPGIAVGFAIIGLIKDTGKCYNSSLK